VPEGDLIDAILRPAEAAFGDRRSAKIIAASARDCRKRFGSRSRVPRNRSFARLVRSDAVFQVGDPFRLCAVRAAEDLPIGLDSVPDDAAAAMNAARCERVDRTFKAVKGPRRSRQRHLERLVVVVSRTPRIRPFVTPLVRSRHATRIPVFLRARAGSSSPDDQDVTTRVVAEAAVPDTTSVGRLVTRQRRARTRPR